jgi:hypothetical protein
LSSTATSCEPSLPPDRVIAQISLLTLSAFILSHNFFLLGIFLLTNLIVSLFGEKPSSASPAANASSPSYKNARMHIALAQAISPVILRCAFEYCLCAKWLQSVSVGQTKLPICHLCLLRPGLLLPPAAMVPPAVHQPCGTAVVPTEAILFPHLRAFVFVPETLLSFLL